MVEVSSSEVSKTVLSGDTLDSVTPNQKHVELFDAEDETPRIINFPPPVPNEKNIVDIDDMRKKKAVRQEHQAIQDSESESSVVQNRPPLQKQEPTTHNRNRENDSQIPIDVQTLPQTSAVQQFTSLEGPSISKSSLTWHSPSVGTVVQELPMEHNIQVQTYCNAEDIEEKAQAEAARLSEIEEVHESQASDCRNSISKTGKGDDPVAEDSEKNKAEIDGMKKKKAAKQGKHQAIEDSDSGSIVVQERPPLQEQEPTKTAQHISSLSGLSQESTESHGRSSGELVVRDSDMDDNGPPPKPEPILYEGCQDSLPDAPIESTFSVIASGVQSMQSSFIAETASITGPVFAVAEERDEDSPNEKSYDKSQVTATSIQTAPMDTVLVSVDSASLLDAHQDKSAEKIMQDLNERALDENVIESAPKLQEQEQVRPTKEMLLSSNEGVPMTTKKDSSRDTVIVADKSMITTLKSGLTVDRPVVSTVCDRSISSVTDHSATREESASSVNMTSHGKLSRRSRIDEDRRSPISMNETKRYERVSRRDDIGLNGSGRVSSYDKTKAFRDCGPVSSKVSSYESTRGRIASRFTSPVISPVRTSSRNYFCSTNYDASSRYSSYSRSTTPTYPRTYVSSYQQRTQSLPRRVFTVEKPVRSAVCDRYVSSVTDRHSAMEEYAASISNRLMASITSRSPVTTTRARTVEPDAEPVLSSLGRKTAYMESLERLKLDYLSPRPFSVHSSWQPRSAYARLHSVSPTRRTRSVSVEPTSKFISLRDTDKHQIQYSSGLAIDTIDVPDIRSRTMSPVVSVTTRRSCSFSPVRHIDTGTYKERLARLRDDYLDPNYTRTRSPSPISFSKNNIRKCASELSVVSAAKLNVCSNNKLDLTIRSEGRRNFTQELLDAEAHVMYARALEVVSDNIQKQVLGAAPHRPCYTPSDSVLTSNYKRNCISISCLHKLDNDQSLVRENLRTKSPSIPIENCCHSERERQVTFAA